jgi:hypothetical protein
MKYYVLIKESNQAEVREFDNLNAAYRFFLEDPVKREIVKPVDPKVTE